MCIIDLYKFNLNYGLILGFEHVCKHFLCIDISFLQRFCVVVMFWKDMCSDVTVSLKVFMHGV